MDLHFTLAPGLRARAVAVFTAWLDSYVVWRSPRLAAAALAAHRNMRSRRLGGHYRKL
ncbi:MAG: hypothetical protein AB7O70_15615 [Hyphomicrobiales bacterium]